MKLREDKIKKLPNAIKGLLPNSAVNKFTEYRELVKCNQKFFDDLVNYQYNHFFDFDQPPSLREGSAVSLSQMHRNQAVLHSLVREWSSLGQIERDQCFTPLLELLKKHVPIDKQQRRKRVLVPGCGLGRLAVEIAGLGYACQANEYSVYMIMGSNFLLNGISMPQKYKIYPWIDKYVGAFFPVFPHVETEFATRLIGKTRNCA